MMNIISPLQRIRVKEYALSFTWKDQPGAGFSFPCDKAGIILYGEMQPAGLENLEKCLNGTYAVAPQGIQDYSHTYIEPAQGLCSCRHVVELRDFTNTCECGLEYNSSGQLLAPRCQWEEPWDEDEGVISGYGIAD